MRIRNRDDVIGYVGTQCGNRSIRRAVSEGDVEFLGGFEPVGSDPCWILRATTPRGKRFNVALVANRDGTYSIRQIPQVPWDYWLGDTRAGKMSSVIHGDRPERYGYLKTVLGRLNNAKET